MPHSKKEGILLSVTMSLIMIYVMAALNECVKHGAFSAEAWVVSLKRLPLGFIVGIVCDMAICTPLSRKLVEAVSDDSDRECFKVLILRFSMVVLMTVAMTVFSVLITWEDAQSAVAGFFTYLPYNFTIALPMQMLIVAPVSLRLARAIAKALPASA